MAAVLIAILGDESQEIIVTTQLLLRQGEPLTNVVVLHSQLRSIEDLNNTFTTQAQWPSLTCCSVAIDDRLKPSQFDVFSDALFMVIEQWLNKEYRIHLLFANQCKSMIMLGMSVAQLSLRKEDHIWYLDNSGERQQLFETRLPHLYFVCRVLTSAERMIVHLLAKNMSNSKIAEQLSVEEKTIKNQISNIYKKLKEQFVLSSNLQEKRDFLQKNVLKRLDESYESPKLRRRNKLYKSR